MIQLSKNMRFLAVLVDADKPLPIAVIASRSGLSLEEVSKIAPPLAKKKRVSRRKPKLSEGGGYYHYWLTKNQKRMFLNHSSRRTPVRGAELLKEITGKLDFLKTVSERTIYGDSPLMQSIIEDYMRLLRIEDLKELELEQDETI